MSTYAEEILVSKKYTGNVVIQIGSNYFAIREPDSGLSISSPYDKAVSSLVLNPATIDIRRVSTTISSFQFRLLDKDGIVSALVLGDASALIGAQVRIFLGRSNVDMAFSDYFELPKTFIGKLEHSDNTYVFNCSEQTEKMAKAIYNFQSALAVDILAATTTWTMRDAITNFPTSGYLKIENEFVSYSGKDAVNNRFTGVVRGELNSTAADHDANSEVVLVQTVTDNPLNIILKLLISNGGGGTYDTLQDGLGISNTLVDITGIEALRDELFNGISFTLSIYNVDSALKYIEKELLTPNNLRLTNSRSSKITLAILDRSRFVEEYDVINEDTITKFPKWSLDGNKVTNVIDIKWDFNEGTNQFQKRNVYSDSTSISAYGEQDALVFEFKGPKSSSGGQNIVDDFGGRLLERLKLPTPEVTINTQMDKSLQTIGDKAYLVSSKIPAADGTLNFASNLEIVSRSINQTNGDVQFKLAFTSFTNIRSAFIAPSDLITSFLSQKKVNVVAGRGASYLVGWYMLLWDELNQTYCSDPPNKIVSILEGEVGLLTEDGDSIVTEDGDPLILDQASTEDSIVFEDDWATTLIASGRYRIRFANYNDAITSQKRYGFLSNAGADFDDDKSTYRITL